MTGVASDVLARLMTYEFPGNVRELENVIEHAFALCSGGLVERKHLPPELTSASADAGTQQSSDMTLRSMESICIADALRRNGWNRTAAARELGIHPSTLFRKIKNLGITLPATDGRHHAG